MPGPARPAPDAVPAAVVVGNPKAASRTRLLAERVAADLAESLAVPLHTEVTELATFGGALFDWSSPEVGASVAQVQASRLLVVATPVYKASFTGLLKAFLDWFPAGSLGTVVTVPVMVGAAPHHALAVETQLRPVLVELGAPMPTRGLFVLEEQFDDLAGALTPWLDVAVPQLAPWFATPAATG